MGSTPQAIKDTKIIQKIANNPPKGKADNQKQNNLKMKIKIMILTEIQLAWISP